MSILRHSFRPHPSRALPLLLLAALALVSGCETPGRVEWPELTFQHRPAILLAVARVEVVDSYISPFAEPHVEHLFPTPPAKAVKNWVRARLVAAGDEGSARVVIRDASVVAVPLPTRGGIEGLFWAEQAERYDAALEVAVELFDSRGERRAFASTRASRSRSVAEDVTLNERERLWFEMTEALMHDFDVEMERSIREHLADHLAGPS